MLCNSEDICVACTVSSLQLQTLQRNSTQLYSCSLSTWLLCLVRRWSTTTCLSGYKIWKGHSLQLILNIEVRNRFKVFILPNQIFGELTISCVEQFP